MKRYFPVVSGLVALGIEVLVYLSLMELPPFGKGGSDIAWGLPFFGLVVLAVAIPGFSMALKVKSKYQEDRRSAIVGLVANGLSLAVLMVLLLAGIVRAVVFE